jgi:hypothetical protein
MNTPGLLANTAFGPGSTLSDNLMGVAEIVFGVGFFFFLGWGILKLLRASDRTVQHTQQKVLKKISPAQPGDTMISFTYTTYFGFVLWMTQVTCEYQLPASQAMPTLNALLRHNLTRGLLGPGAVFVPILATLDYWKQRRIITVQSVRGFPVK